MKNLILITLTLVVMLVVFNFYAFLIDGWIQEAVRIIKLDMGVF